MRVEEEEAAEVEAVASQAAEEAAEEVEVV